MSPKSGDQPTDSITTLGDQVRSVIQGRKQRVRQIARRIHAEAKEEEAELRSRGWRQKDFARALVELLEQRRGRD